MPDSGLNRAVILTAIPVEYQAVQAHLTEIREETHLLGTVYGRGKFSSGEVSWDVGIVEVGAGNADTALAAERAIAHFNPAIVFFVGVAGGLKDVALGDVVAATKIYGYESGKADIQFETRPDVGNSAFRMEERARAEAKKQDWLKRIGNLIPDPPPRVFVAPIASGDQVIASTDSTTWALLRTHFSDAVAVEMEGRGLFRATRAHPQIEVLLIRGISDLIEGKQEADARNFQQIAARHASAFAFEILAKIDIPSSQQKPVESESLPSENVSSAPTSEPQSTKTSLDEFYKALSQYHQQVKKNICDLFNERKDIPPGLCDSAIKLLEQINDHIHVVCGELDQANYFDRARLINIQEIIKKMISALLTFRRLPRTGSTMAQKRDLDTSHKEIRTECELLLVALDQLRTKQ